MSVSVCVERRYCILVHIKQMNIEYSFDKLSIAVAMYCLIQHVFLLRDRVMLYSLYYVFVVVVATAVAVLSAVFHLQPDALYRIASPSIPLQTTQ